MKDSERMLIELDPDEELPDVLDKSYIDFLEDTLVNYSRNINSTIKEIESDGYGPYMSKKTVIDILNLIRDSI